MYEIHVYSNMSTARAVLRFLVGVVLTVDGDSFLFLAVSLLRLAPLDPVLVCFVRFPLPV